MLSEMSCVIAATDPTGPCLALALVGLAILAFPKVYLKINYKLNPGPDPIESKAVPRIIGTAVIILAAAVWLWHRPR